MFLSAVQPVVTAMTDTMRPILLIGFVLAMFGVAGLAILVGQRRTAQQQARALSGDTGVDQGAVRGSDTTFSDSWLAETRAEVGPQPPQQSWADLILGTEAGYETAASTPEVPDQQPAGPQPPVSWAAPVTDGWQTPAGETTAWDAAPAETAAPEFPAYLQPETSPEVPAYLQSELDTAPVSDVEPPAPYRPGKHAAPAPWATAETPTPPPFLVDDFLDEE